MREGTYTLITGGAGFIGSNLADFLLENGERVIVFDNLSRAGVEANVKWLTIKHATRFRFEVGDVTDARRLGALVRQSHRIYHLAAQVAVTTSLVEPRLDLETNLLGTFNLLEAAREMNPRPTILFSSTNKVYGGLEGAPIVNRGGSYAYADGRAGITEGASLDFYSPYGCSKGAADQYVRDYGRVFGVPTVVFRMSCVYGTRQFGTEDQGWVAHFARALLGSSPITIYGDGCQIRDILWVGDLVDAMNRAADAAEEVPGEVFNIGGGPANAVTVCQVIETLMELTGRRVPVRMSEWRPGDQRIYVSDTSKAERRLGWRPKTSWEDGLERLVEWLREAQLSTPVLQLLAAERTRIRATAGL